VLAAVLWVGGAFTLQFLAIRAERSNDSVKLAALGQDAEFVGTRVFAPASFAVLIFGIIVVIDQPAWTFGQFWILFALAVSILSALVGRAYFGPESGRLGRLAEERGIDDPEVRVRMKRLLMISRIELVLLLLVVADIVAKPGL